MKETFKEQLKQLRLPVLLESWDQVIKEATGKNLSYSAFLKEILTAEIRGRQQRAKQLRRKKAKIPDHYEMTTYPFEKQPKLNRKQVFEIYDSMEYLLKSQNIALIGPTGVGKTGLATAYLNRAIDHGASGRFILFSDLITELYQSIADSSTKKVLKRFEKYDCLLIDEMGYTEVENPAQSSLLFKLIRARKKCTIITSNLGFDEWQRFLKDENLVAALLNKFTSNCHLINMLSCKSITPQLIQPTK